MDDGGQWFIFSIPAPPSVNDFKAKLGNSTPKVREWITQADKHLMMQKTYPRLTGDFEILIIWKERYFSIWDIDNRIKPLLDWMQRVELIKNDKWCRKMTVEWATVLLGCEVRIRRWEHDAEA